MFYRSTKTKAAVAGLLLGAMSLAPSAHAIVGVATLNPAVIVAGLATGAGIGALDLLTGGALGPMIYLMPIVLLDGENGQTPEFRHISNQEARDFGLSAAEVQAYNSELEEINQIAGSVASGLQTISESHEVKAEDSKRLWEKNRKNISPSAYSALQKIVNTSTQKAQR